MIQNVADTSTSRVVRNRLDQLIQFLVKEVPIIRFIVNLQWLVHLVTMFFLLMPVLERRYAYYATGTVRFCRCTDMSKKSKDRLRDPAF